MFIRFTDIHSQPQPAVTRLKFVLIAVAAVSLLAPSLTGAQDKAPMAVKAEFVRELAVPGSMDQFLRPAKIYYDRAADELYVADQGNNRIVIFNRQGTYRFEFAMAGRIGSIVDFAVSPAGYVYVLGSAREGRKLLRFDFDGLFLGVLLDGPDGMASMDVISLTIDEHQNLYLLDAAAPQLVKLNEDGVIVKRTPILGDIDDKARHEMVYGSLSATSHGLLLPLSSLGVVYEFDFDGEHIGGYGYQGTTTGELNFPVSAAMNDAGMVVVLDKRRFNVLCYAPNGKFLGEFGGKGNNPGWFYLPSYLTADETDQVYVSQVFLNRVQICRIPESIQRRFDAQQAAAETPSMSATIPVVTDENTIASNPVLQPTQGGTQ